MLCAIRLEIADAQSRHGALDAVDDSGAFAHQRLALTARPPVVFCLERRDRRHCAVAAFTPQPAQKGAFQQIDIQPVCLCPPVLARHRHARCMNDISLDAVRSQPAREPEAVPPGFVGDRDTRNRPTRLGCFVPPALQQAQQHLGIRHEFLQRVTLDSRHDPTDQPAPLAHLDHGDQRAILVQSGERSAQVIRLWHGAPRRFVAATIVPSARRSPHTILIRGSTIGPLRKGRPFFSRAPRVLISGP